jgi:acetolactate synthase I/II/III large subunit
MSQSASSRSAKDVYYNKLINLNVTQLLLEFLKIEGVTRIFGIPGGAAVYLMDELHRQADRFDFVVCRHETGAAYLAHGYAVVTDGLGVVLTTSGPGAINAVTGAMNAQASEVSMLVITGEIASSYFGRAYLQEGIDAKLNVDAIYQNAVQSSAVISAQSNFATLFQQALRDARGLPGRVAHISLPNDIAGTCVQTPGLTDPAGNNIVLVPKTSEQYRTVPQACDSVRVGIAFEQLVSSRKPLIFIGNGCRSALRDPARRAAFIALVDKFALPVMTTPGAKGLFPETHPLSLRNYGETACAWPEQYMHAAKAPPYDTLLVLGSGLGELSTSILGTDLYSKTLLPSEHFIQIDADQSVIGQNFPLTLGIVSELAATIDLMCMLGKGRRAPRGVGERKAEIRGIKKDPNSAFSNSAWRDSEAAPINPAALARIVNEVVTEGHLFVDGGNPGGWALNNMIVDPPLEFHIELSMAALGFAVGAVIGGKFGAPDLPCVALVGDGSFMMHGVEISTAAQNRVGAVWIVMFNNDLAMASQAMAVQFPPAAPWSDYYKLGSPDLARFSEALGARAVTVARSQRPSMLRKELRHALRRAKADRQPQVIVVEIDPVPAPPYGWPRLGPVQCGPQA